MILRVRKKYDPKPQNLRSWVSVFLPIFTKRWIQKSSTMASQPTPPNATPHSCIASLLMAYLWKPNGFFLLSPGKFNPLLLCSNARESVDLLSSIHPKDHWTLKTGVILRTRTYTPAFSIGFSTLPLEAVDGRNPANQLRLIVYPNRKQGLAPSKRWLFGISEPSTVRALPIPKGHPQKKTPIVTNYSYQLT